VRKPSATGSATELLPDLLPADPDLAIVVDAWDRLPEAVRAGIVVLVKAAAKWARPGPRDSRLLAGGPVSQRKPKNWGGRPSK
jgi:hypothetical protein